MKINKTVWVKRFLACYTPFFGRLRATATLTPDSEFTHIAIYSSTALGDLMFNTPAIHAIKQRYPNAKLTLVSSQKNSHLVENSRYFERVLYWDNKVRNVLRLVWQLRRQRPQLTIILHSYMPYDMLAAVLSGSEYIIRDHYACDSAILNRWLAAYPGKSPGYLHLIQRKLDLLHVLGCDIHDTQMRILVDFPKVTKTAGTVLIGFQMGASETIRRWPISHFVALAKQLVRLGKPIPDCADWQP